MVDLQELIETVREQGCVRLINGEEGIPRKIEISPEGETVEVSTDSGTYDYDIEEIEQIIFIG